MLVAGAGIGTGILTIPYAIDKIGILGTFLALVLAYAISAVMYLMIADLTLNSQRSTDLIGILDEHLFRGKGKRVLCGVFFVVLVLLLLENLVVYILCAANVLQDLWGLHSIVSKILFYLAASLVIFFGIKGVGIGEKFSVGLIGSVVITLSILSCFHVKRGLSVSFGEPKLVFAVYGLFMFAFSAIFSIIQVCNNIEKQELVGKAVIGGLTINALITVLFTVAVILGSKEVTEIATIGLSESIGIPFVKVICSVFVLLAMFSSYWSSGFAFADVVSEGFSVSKRSAWMIATIPTVVIAILLPLTVLEYVQIGAGVLSIILVIVVMPAYYNAVRSSHKRPLLGRMARSKALLALVAMAICLMAVAALIPIT